LRIAQWAVSEEWFLALRKDKLAGTGCACHGRMRADGFHKK
jgi:hypothetical protein